MITKFFIFILVFSSLIIISNFITRNNNERFQAETTQSQTTQASEDNSTTQASEDNSTTQEILHEHETDMQETEIETNYDNYFQGGFCKYQEKLGYQVGCSDHIYDSAFFDIDRELNSVKDNYSIFKSELKS
jgi:hypothetical protein